MAFNNKICEKLKISFESKCHKSVITQLKNLTSISELNNIHAIEYLYIWHQNDFILENGQKIFSSIFIIYNHINLLNKSLNKIFDELTKFSITKYNGFVIFVEILKGVNYLVKQSLFHKFLNPWNILILIETNKSIVKITDIGIETIDSQLNHHKSDNKYSLGVVLQIFFEVTINR